MVVLNELDKLNVISKNAQLGEAIITFPRSLEGHDHILDEVIRKPYKTNKKYSNGQTSPNAEFCIINLKR